MDAENATDAADGKIDQNSLFAILACPSGEPAEILRRNVLEKNA